MPYIIARKGKPTMYQQGEREWVCTGSGQTTTGASQRGAYTRWKNLVALAEMSSLDADRMKAARRDSAIGAAFRISELGALR